MRHQSNIDVTPEEASHRAKWWSWGNNLLEKMRKDNEHLWAVKRVKTQTKLDI